MRGGKRERERERKKSTDGSNQERKDLLRCSVRRHLGDQCNTLDSHLIKQQAKAANQIAQLQRHPILLLLPGSRSHRKNFLDSLKPFASSPSPNKRGIFLGVNPISSSFVYIYRCVFAGTQKREGCALLTPLCHGHFIDHPRRRRVSPDRLGLGGTLWPSRESIQQRQTHFGRATTTGGRRRE